MNSAAFRVATLVTCGLVLVLPASAQDSPLGTPSPEELGNADASEPASSLDDEPEQTTDGEPAFDASGRVEPEPERAPNSVYAEGLGSGLVYSLNYERLLDEDVAARVGFGYTSVSATAGTASASSSLITIPVTVSYLGVGGKHHMLELGGGLTVFHSSGSASSVGVSASAAGTTVFPELLLGYRLHPVDGAGFQLRVGAMAFAGKGLGITSPDPTKFGVLPWFYLSLGASF